MAIKYSGFTLAELLIVLAILGVIATFTIPKVLNSQQDSQKKAVFKEIIATFYQVSEMGVNDGVLTTTSMDSQQEAYYFQHINFVKTCDTDSLAQGCWNVSQGDLPFDDDESGGIMYNGAVVVGLGHSGNSSRESITIDWNGLAGPNTEGKDQLHMDMCYMAGSSVGCFIDAAYDRIPYPSYHLGPFSGASTTLWDEIFAQ